MSICFRPLCPRTKVLWGCLPWMMIRCVSSGAGFTLSVLYSKYKHKRRVIDFYYFYLFSTQLGFFEDFLSINLAARNFNREWVKQHSSALACVLLILKRRVRTAHRRVARPKPTCYNVYKFSVYVYLSTVLNMFSLSLFLLYTHLQISAACLVPYFGTSCTVKKGQINATLCTAKKDSARMTDIYVK
jgi:hypothetical protein